MGGGSQAGQPSASRRLFDQSLRLRFLSPESGRKQKTPKKFTGEQPSISGTFGLKGEGGPRQPSTCGTGLRYRCAHALGPYLPHPACAHRPGQGGRQIPRLPCQEAGRAKPRGRPEEGAGPCQHCQQGGAGPCGPPSPRWGLLCGRARAGSWLRQILDHTDGAECGPGLCAWRPGRPGAHNSP